MTNPVAVLTEPNLTATKILAAVPNNPKELSSSFVRNLLGELSIFFFSLPADALDSNTSRTVGQYRRYVEDVWPVLSVVSSITSQTKAGKPASLSNADMAGTIHSFGMKAPSNPKEAIDVTNKIMNFLTQILSVRNCVYFSYAPCTTFYSSTWNHYPSQDLGFIAKMLISIVMGISVTTLNRNQVNLQT